MKKITLALFNTSMLTIFYGLFFYFFATPLLISIIISITFGMLYYFFFVTTSFDIASIARLLLAVFVFLTIIFVYSFANDEICQLLSYLPLIPIHIIFLLLLAPVLSIPILSYIVIVIVIHRKLVLEDQYLFSNTFWGIIPFLLGILWFYSVRIA